MVKYGPKFSEPDVVDRFVEYIEENNPAFHSEEQSIDDEIKREEHDNEGKDFTEDPYFESKNDEEIR